MHIECRPQTALATFSLHTNIQSCPKPEITTVFPCTVRTKSFFCSPIAGSLPVAVAIMTGAKEEIVMYVMYPYMHPDACQCSVDLWTAE